MPANPFSNFDIDGWNIQQTIQMFEIIKKNEYSQTVNGKKVLNDKGLEKILFTTLSNMGISGKVILQKMDNDSNVFTINQNSDGSTSPIPCP